MFTLSVHNAPVSPVLREHLGLMFIKRQSRTIGALLPPLHARFHACMEGELSRRSLMQEFRIIEGNDGLVPELPSSRIAAPRRREVPRAAMTAEDMQRDEPVGQDMIVCNDTAPVVERVLSRRMGSRPGRTRRRRGRHTIDIMGAPRQREAEHGERGRCHADAHDRRPASSASRQRPSGVRLAPEEQAVLAGSPDGPGNIITPPWSVWSIWLRSSWVREGGSTADLSRTHKPYIAMFASRERTMRQPSPFMGTCNCPAVPTDPMMDRSMAVPHPVETRWRMERRSIDENRSS
jgi:hypothetical protein